METTLTITTDHPIVVIGGAGKTGRRVLERLESLGIPAHGVSRSTSPRFDWDDPDTWPGALEGASAAYITYQPDLAVPGAPEAVGALAATAVELGVSRLVLLSGRGEPEAQRSEQAVFASGAEATVVRCSWFSQNFSEGALADAVAAGVVGLPAGPDAIEPFVDADDIAAVVVASLTQPGHGGRVHELTGPRAIPLGEVAEILGAASGREVSFAAMSQEQFAEALAQDGLPEDVAQFLAGLFATVLDGRNAETTTDVEDVLGRPARAFEDFAQAAAARGAWDLAGVR